MARPTNEERYSPAAQREELRKLCGDAIVNLRRQIKNADPATLARIITQVSPLVLNDDTQSTSDVTLELLSQRALRVRMAIRETAEQQQISEPTETEDET